MKSSYQYDEYHVFRLFLFSECDATIVSLVSILLAKRFFVKDHADTHDKA
jgi:hypothetical protein